MNIIFQINGGIGKSIAATAVCKAIKKQYPEDKLIVVSAYPDVFLCNPHVHKVLNHDNLSYFYRDYIEGQQVKMMLHDPYQDGDFINGDRHLIAVWCGMNGVAYSGEQPELFITQRERDMYARAIGAQKPVLLIQTNGGAPQQANQYSWARDLPLQMAQEVVNAFAYDYQVVHIRREDQPALQNTTPVQMGLRALAVLIQMSAKRLFIDSFAQHAAAALNKPSVVCWIGNRPEQFGYDMHTNIMANEPTLKPELRHSVYSRYNISGQATEFPYNNEGELFDVDVIIDKLAAEPTDIATDAPADMLLRRKIAIEVRRNSMVAQRLQCLLGKADLTSINRVLDIGSWHLGQSIEFAKIFAGAKIDAFEPVPDSYKLCMSRLRGLSAEKKNRIQVHNIALSHEEGTIPFYPVSPAMSSVPNVGASSMFRFKEGLNGTAFGQNLVQVEINVQADTLDNWCSKNNVNEVDIMWVDAQGAELHIFKGAEETLKNTKIIMTEVGLKPYYEGHTLKPEIDAFLSKHGFHELEDAFEVNVPEYEANTIYIKS